MFKNVSELKTLKKLEIVIITLFLRCWEIGVRNFLMLFFLEKFNIFFYKLFTIHFFYNISFKIYDKFINLCDFFFYLKPNKIRLLSLNSSHHQLLILLHKRRHSLLGKLYLLLLLPVR